MRRVHITRNIKLARQLKKLCIKPPITGANMEVRDAVRAYEERKRDAKTRSAPEQHVTSGPQRSLSTPHAMEVTPFRSIATAIAIDRTPRPNPCVSLIGRKKSPSVELMPNPMPLITPPHRMPRHCRPGRPPTQHLAYARAPMSNMIKAFDRLR